MQTKTHYPFGQAPTPGEVEAAMRHARALRSEVFHNVVKRSAKGCGRACQQLRESLTFRSPALLRRADAPFRVAGRSFWGNLPRTPRWIHTRRGRVL